MFVRGFVHIYNMLCAYYLESTADVVTVLLVDNIIFIINVSKYIDTAASFIKKSAQIKSLYLVFILRL